MKDCKSVRELRQLVLSQKITSKELCEHYCYHAYETGRKLSLTADENFTRALEIAEERDKQLQQVLDEGKDPEKELGKFFGVPFSVKDQIYVKGTRSTMGVGSRAEKITDEDAASVALIMEQGGIPFVKGKSRDFQKSFSFNKSNVQI